MIQFQFNSLTYYFVQCYLFFSIVNKMINQENYQFIIGGVIGPGICLVLGYYLSVKIKLENLGLVTAFYCGIIVMCILSMILYFWKKNQYFENIKIIKRNEEKSFTISTGKNLHFVSVLE